MDGGYEHAEAERRGARRLFLTTSSLPSPSASHGNGHQEGLILPASVGEKQSGNESNPRQGCVLTSHGAAGKAGTSRKIPRDGIGSAFTLQNQSRGAPGEGRIPQKAGASWAAPFRTGRDGGDKASGPLSPDAHCPMILEPPGAWLEEWPSVSCMASSREESPIDTLHALPGCFLGPGLRTSGEDICSHLAPHISALGPQLIDLGLGNVRSLLCLLQLMLHPPALGQLRVGLLLLNGRGGGKGLRKPPTTGLFGWDPSPESSQGTWRVRGQWPNPPCPGLLPALSVGGQATVPMY